MIKHNLGDLYFLPENNIIPLCKNSSQNAGNIAENKYSFSSKPCVILTLSGLDSRSYPKRWIIVEKKSAINPFNKNRTTPRPIEISHIFELICLNPVSQRVFLKFFETNKECKSMGTASIVTIWMRNELNSLFLIMPLYPKTKTMATSVIDK